MNEQEKELAQLIESILSNENTNRKENELNLNKMIKSNPNAFMHFILNILSSS